MQLVSDVANIAFVNVADNGLAPGQGNRRIGFYNVNHQDVPYWGVAKDYVTEHEDAPYGEIYGVNSAVNLWRANSQGGWSIGESNPRKLMHELLHTIGLDHPGPYNGDSADYEGQALFQQDSNQYSVMSYWLAAATGADHEANGVSWFASTPLLYDIASLQHLYGANMTTRTGDTVYGFNSTAGREVFDFALHPQAVVAIWDAGGEDTLDLSGYATPSTIDLHQGAFSDAGGLTDNIAIAYGARIENAIGGAGADVLIGNGASNQLTGGGGGDLFAYTYAIDASRYAPRSDGKKAAPDVLTDFTSGVDRIDLSAIDAVAGTAPNEAFTAIGAAAFGHHAGELRWETSGGTTRISADLDGDGLADFQLLAIAPSLQVGDFIL
jgi:serralysin